MAEDEGEVVEFREEDVGQKAEARKLLEEVQGLKQQRYLDDAIKVAMKASEAFKAIDDSEGQAEAMMEVADACEQKQDFGGAFDAANSAIAISKEGYDDDIEGSAHLMLAHITVGALEAIVNSGQGLEQVDQMWVQATTAGKAALELARKSHNAPGQAQSLYIISRAHLAGKHEKEAERFAGQSYSIAKGLRIYELAAAARLTQAQVHNNTGKVEDAMGYAKEALSMALNDKKNGGEMAKQASEYLNAVYEASRPYVDDGQGGAREDPDWAVSYGGLAIAHCRRFKSTRNRPH